MTTTATVQTKTVALTLDDDTQTTLIAKFETAETWLDEIHGLIYSNIGPLLDGSMGEVVPCEVYLHVKPGTGPAALLSAAAALRSAGYRVLIPED